MLFFLAHNIINSSIYVFPNIWQSSGIYATNCLPDSYLKMFDRLYSFRIYLVFLKTPEEEFKLCQIRRPSWPVNRSPVTPKIYLFLFPSILFFLVTFPSLNI